VRKKEGDNYKYKNLKEKGYQGKKRITGKKYSISIFDL